MVNRPRGGTVLIELTIAIGILAVVAIAVATAWHTDLLALRANYYRAVAMEIVDGEMEALVAGEWQAHGDGTHAYTVQADAAKNLPDGKFVLTIKGKAIRLEWLPARRGKGGRVAREVTLR